MNWKFLQIATIIMVIALYLSIMKLQNDFNDYIELDMRLGYEVMDFIPAQTSVNGSLMGILLEIDGRLKYLEQWD